MSNKVFQTAYKAQFGRGAESYMFSWTNNTGHVRDTEKLFSSDVTILSRATNLVFVVSFYNAWFACKLDFPVMNQTHFTFSFSETPSPGKLEMLVLNLIFRLLFCIGASKFNNFIRLK